MDGDYINRLQSIVSIKLHQEHRVGSKNVEKVKRTDTTGVDEMCQTSQTNQADETVPQSSRSEKVAVPLAPNEDIQSHISMTNLARQQQRTIPNLKPDIRSATTHVPLTLSSSHQPECDSIETSLAKITCSQRAICSSIDSLM